MIVQQLSDSELLGVIAQGDEAALRELVERHSAWLLLRLRRRTPDEDVAAEALHDAFVAVWRNPRSFRGDGDVGGWLGGIAIRQLVSRLRKRAQPMPIESRMLSALSPTVRSAEDELLVAVGNRADLALLEADPLAPGSSLDQATALREMHVAATWVAGRLVHTEL